MHPPEPPLGLAGHNKTTSRMYTYEFPLAQPPPKNQEGGISPLGPLLCADSGAGSTSFLGRHKEAGIRGALAVVSPAVLITSLAEGTFAFLPLPNN